MFCKQIKDREFRYDSPQRRRKEQCANLPQGQGIAVSFLNYQTRKDIFINLMLSSYLMRQADARKTNLFLSSQCILLVSLSKKRYKNIALFLFKDSRQVRTCRNMSHETGSIMNISVTVVKTNLNFIYNNCMIFDRCINLIQIMSMMLRKYCHEYS